MITLNARINSFLSALGRENNSMGEYHSKDFVLLKTSQWNKMIAGMDWATLSLKHRWNRLSFQTQILQETVGLTKLTAPL